MGSWEQAKAEVGGLKTGLDRWEWEMSVLSRDELQGTLEGWQALHRHDLGLLELAQDTVKYDETRIKFLQNLLDIGA